MDITLKRILQLASEKKEIEGVSDSQMEREMGLPTHSFNKWATFQTKSYSRKEHLSKLADYFGVSVAYLSGETNQKPRRKKRRGR